MPFVNKQNRAYFISKINQVLLQPIERLMSRSRRFQIKLGKNISKESTSRHICGRLDELDQKALIGLEQTIDPANNSGLATSILTRHTHRMSPLKDLLKSRRNDILYLICCKKKTIIWSTEKGMFQKVKMI